jgi:hypothetical protein
MVLCRRINCEAVAWLGLAGIALYGTIMAQAIYGLIHRWQVS